MYTYFMCIHISYVYIFHMYTYFICIHISYVYIFHIFFPIMTLQSIKGEGQVFYGQEPAMVGQYKPQIKFYVKEPCSSNSDNL